MARKKQRETARVWLKPKPGETDEQWWERVKEDYLLRKALRHLSDEEIRKGVEALESSSGEPLLPETIDRIVKYAIDHANDE